MIKSWKAFIWTCYYCSNHFKDYVALINHIKSSHPIVIIDNMYFKCDDCDNVYLNYTSFLNHVRNDHHETLKLCCDVCNEVLGNFEELSCHRDTHVEAGVVQPIVYHCTSCEKVHLSEKELKKHIQKTHSDISRAINSEDFKLMEGSWDDKSNIFSEKKNSVDNDTMECKEEYFEIGEVFQCGICVNSFSNETDLEVHKAQHMEKDLPMIDSFKLRKLDPRHSPSKRELNFDQKLIEEVKNNNVLFNIHHPQYKNVYKKDAIWRQIAMQLNSDTELCKRKWKGLRDSYKKQKRQEELSCGSMAIKRKRWKHFDYLTFLDDIDTSRRIVSNVEAPYVVVSSPTNTPGTPYRSDCESASLEPTQESQNSQKLSEDTKEENLTSKHYQDLFRSIVNNIQETCDRLNAKRNDHVETTFISFAQQINASDLPRERVLKLQRRISNIIFDILDEWEEDKRSKNN